MAGLVEANAGWRGSPWRIAGWGAAALLLLVPLVAMQFTDDVNWSVFDFAFMAALLGGVGLGLELAVRKGNAAYSLAAGIALAAAFLLVVITGAVGIIGSETNPANLMFAGVLTIALVGAVIARFRPLGMARTMAATAAAQALAAVITLAAGLGSTEPPGPIKVAILICFFAALWLGSAWLFRKAAREQSPAGAAP